MGLLGRSFHPFPLIWLQQDHPAMSALTTLHYSTPMDSKLRNKRLSSPSSLRDDPFQTFSPSSKQPLRRSRTVTGIPSTITSMMSTDTIINRSPNLKARVRESVHRMSLQDENLGIKSNFTKSDLKQSTNNNKVNTNLPGLYPRLSIEGRTFTNSVKAIKSSFYDDEQETSVEQPSTQSLITLMSKNYHDLSTLKNTNSDDDDDTSSYDSDIELREARKYTYVDIVPSTINLLDDYEPLDLSMVKKRLITDVSPFFHTHEFEPDTATDTDVLLKILSYEFETIDREDEEFGKKATEETPNTVVPWYVKVFRVVGAFCHDFVHLFTPMTKEEYNEKFPWDKFYDPELYYENDMDEDGVLNMDMIPDQLQGTVSNEIEDKATKKRYLYVLRKRG